VTKRELRQIQAVVLVIVSLAYIGFRNLPFNKNSQAAPAARPEKSKYESCYVSRVVDGDTLKLSDNERVRLIGVDTPEVHYSDKLLRDAKSSGKDAAAIQAMGKKASDFTKSLVSDKKVRLEFDVKPRDRYGRLLAYVYLEDGTFVNARIIEEGYGKIMTIRPNVKYSDLFLRLQNEARDKHKGLWGEKGGF
jgi:micrococcal nuclease